MRWDTDQLSKLILVIASLVGVPAEHGSTLITPQVCRKLFVQIGQIQTVDSSASSRAGIHS